MSARRVKIYTTHAHMIQRCATKRAIGGLAMAQVIYASLVHIRTLGGAPAPGGPGEPLSTAAVLSNTWECSPRRKI